jgi:hypothetical protein
MALKIGHRRVCRLQHGAHRAIGNENTLGQSSAE